MEIKKTSRRKWSMFIIGWFLIANSCLSTSYKILMIPISNKSHFACSFEIARSLGLRGHSTYMLASMAITVDSSMDEAARKSNITILRYSCPGTVLSTDGGDKSGDTFASILMNSEDPFAELIEQMRISTPITARDLLLGSEPVMKTLESIEFDMAVIDGTFATKFYYLVAHRLKIPWISYTDYPNPWIMRVPWLPSFVPGQFSMLSESMDFWSRIANLISLNVNRLRQDTVTVPYDVIKEYQKYGSFQTEDELMENSKMWLLTGDPLLDFPRPLMPYMKEVGGLTTRPAKKLPEDLQEFLDGAEEGAIIVSLGSMLSIYPDDLLRKFLDAFDQIHGYRIIWRLHNVGVQLPDNIRARKWLPQNDILAHPKMKLFITHCGNNGQFESLYHGVPMIGFPLLGDQHYNAVRQEYKGYGITMNIRDFTSEDLRDNILKILNDPAYKSRISLASNIFRNAPQRPGEKAAFWVEHVIKFGSEHLETAGKHLSFYQYYMFDIAALIIAVGLVLAFVLYTALAKIIRLCAKTKTVQKAKKL